MLKKLSMLCVMGVAVAMSGCVTQSKYDESQAKNAELEQQYQDLNKAMGAEVAHRDMTITRMRDAIKVSVNSELLFPSGGWEMSDSAKSSIAKIAAILAPHQTTKIHVNGYTDSTPIGPGLKQQGVTTNLILSQKRADNVMQYMISQGVKTDLVAAHGFGEADPVGSNTTAEGRAQNRRVELTVAAAGK